MRRMAVAIALVGIPVAGVVLGGCAGGDAPSAQMATDADGRPEAETSSAPFSLVADSDAERATVEVGPGETAQLRLRVANGGDAPRRFRLGVEGPAAQWVSAPAPLLVAPRQSASTAVSVRVPVDQHGGVTRGVAWAEPLDGARTAGAVPVVYRSTVPVRVQVASR